MHRYSLVILCTLEVLALGIRVREALDLIWQAHCHPPDADSESLSHLDLDFEQGQALQLELLTRYLEQGETLGGWKIGMTSGASRNAMGQGIRPFGFILQSRIIQSGTTLTLDALHTGQVENELCFLIGKELGGGTTRNSARGAVKGVVPAFEVNQKRLPAKASTGVRVADDLSQWGIVVGTPVDPAENYMNMTATLSSHQGVIESVHSAEHIDDHFDSLATLANRLAEYGHSLQPGQHIITGAYGKTPFAEGTFTGEFNAGVGHVEVTLS